jgi:acyl carrier protein
METLTLLFQSNLVKINLVKTEETKMNFEELKALVAEILAVDEDKVKLESKLIDDLGADSLSVVELHMEIEERLGIKIPDEEVAKLSTVEDVLKAIEANK